MIDAFNRSKSCFCLQRNVARVSWISLRQQFPIVFQLIEREYERQASVISVVHERVAIKDRKPTDVASLSAILHRRRINLQNVSYLYSFRCKSRKSKLSLTFKYSGIYLCIKGTIMSGFVAFFLSQEEPMYDKMAVLCVNCFVGLAQMTTVVFLMIGWIWSITWGCAFVGLSGMFY